MDMNANVNDEQGLTYKVLVDDNFHYMEESERYMLGTFVSCKDAVKACKKRVDEFLLTTYSVGMEAETLWKRYVSFGVDPFISTTDKECRFSAWDYARQRCEELCVYGFR